MPQFEALLNLGLVALQLLPESTLVVTGHTDDLGGEAVNETLSMARAQIVVDFMVRGGIPSDRVIARGVGETQPSQTTPSPRGGRRTGASRRRSRGSRLVERGALTASVRSAVTL